MPRRFSVLRLFHPGLWGFFNILRLIFVLGRVVELSYIVAVYMFIKAPIIIFWSNFPLLSKTKSPWPHLYDAFTRKGGYAKQLVGEPVPGSSESDSMFQQADQSQSDFHAYWQLLQDSPLSKAKEKGPGWIKQTTGALIRGQLIELGPTFIKFGQIMSMRPECPAFLREELQLLQDKLPPLPYWKVQQLLEKEMLTPTDLAFGKTLDSIFEWIDEECIGTASLSQVHAAKLRDGREVALKIQRPYLEAIVTVDGAIIKGSIAIISKVFRRAARYDLAAVLTLFTSTLDREIDFIIEAETQRKLRELAIKNPVYRNTQLIAEPYMEYVTSKLLVMELVKNYIRVDRITDLHETAIWDSLIDYEIPQYPPEHKPVPYWATSSLWGDMMLNWGTIHADPHLGNLYFMMPNEQFPYSKMFLCDFGMTVELDEAGKRWLSTFFMGLVYYRNVGKLRDAFLELTPFDEWENVDIPLLGQKVRSMIYRRAVEEEGRTTLRSTRSGTTTLSAEIMYEVLTIPGLHMPDWFWLIMKALSYLEGLGVSMWGGYDFVDMFMPVIIRDMKLEMLNNLQKRTVVDAHEYVRELSEPLSRPGLTRMLSGFGREKEKVFESYVEE
ncbi:MAG: AarF/UbiB family protein [Chloroflexota bacterium]|nr:AarF/UbiB family protein [Chloroflexota bacterium]